jgi:hypothetical protein
MTKDEANTIQVSVKADADASGTLTNTVTVEAAPQLEPCPRLSKLACKRGKASTRQLHAAHWPPTVYCLMVYSFTIDTG